MIIYNAQHNQAKLESEAPAVARRGRLGDEGIKTKIFYVALECRDDTAWHLHRDWLDKR